MATRNQNWMHIFKDPHTAGINKNHTKLLTLVYSSYRLMHFMDEKRLYEDMRERLSEDKIEWMQTNGIDFKSLKITKMYDAAIDEHIFSVFVDIPDSLRTLYKLTFTE